MDVRWGRRGVPPLRGVEDAAPYALFFAGAGLTRPLRSHFYFVILLPVQRFPRKHAVFQRHIPVLLDVMMPHLDGYDLLAYLRPTGTPCIFITAKDAVAERVRGLNSGADDYIVKPFAPTELVARVESVLRRAGRSTAVYTMWEYTVDAAACRVLRGEEEMHLTRKEYDLLLLFLRNRGRALYRDYLYETVWGDDGTGCDTRTLDTHIARLRRKLNLGDRLHSVRQIGYMLEKE